MGEIVDALRRADAAEPARPKSPKELPVAEDRAPRDRPASDEPGQDDLPGSEIVRATSLSHSARPAEAAPHEPEPELTRIQPLTLKGDPDLNWKVARTAIADPRGDATQQFRRLAFRVRELADARDARSIVVTSAQMGDGKTTTICNLAVQLARLDQSQHVVLVDLDLRRPSIAAALGVDVEATVDEVLRGERPLADAIFETDVPGLSILALRQPTTDPELLLAHQNLHAMIRDLEERFDLVLIDSPPVLAVTDVQIILRHAAAGLFVARGGETTIKALKRAIELLPAKKFLGCFLNGSPNTHTRSGYQYYQQTPDSEQEPANVE